MRREPSPVRPDAATRFAAIGFDFATIDGEPYWDESARYVFTLDQIEQGPEKATEELAALCDELVDRVVRDEAALARLKIPEHAWGPIAESRRQGDPSLHGRFDFSWNGEGPPKLLEYNADTPTGLVEAAVVQWQWLEDMVARGALPEEADQFNSLHEKLVERWRAIAGAGPLHLACMRESREDSGTTDYLEHCARLAGIETIGLDMGDVGHDGFRLVDRRAMPIDLLFKLYPWEWAFADEFGRSDALGRTRFFEPPWKLILSNKGMLALLWEMAPGHPNLLPTFFEDDPKARILGDRHARKPLFSREGADVRLVDGTNRSDGPAGGYGAEGWIRQELAPLPRFGDGFAVIGSWVVGSEPAGMGIREDASPVTTDRARFVPHVILD